MIKEYFSSRKSNMTSPFDSSSKKKKFLQPDRFIPHSVSKNIYSLFNDASNTLSSKTDKPSSSGQKSYSNFLEQNLIENLNSKTTGKLLHFGEDSKPCFDKENVDLNL